MSLYSRLKGAGPSGFGYGSSAEQVLAGADLAGKTYLLTGCNSGIGHGSMRALAAAGATVLGAARSAEKALTGATHISARHVQALGEQRAHGGQVGRGRRIVVFGVGRGHDVGRHGTESLRGGARHGAEPSRSLKTAPFARHFAEVAASGVAGSSTMRCIASGPAPGIRRFGLVGLGPQISTTC
jgi:hypothetical protein